MTSKIFKSSYMSDSSRLEIETSIASTSFHITHCTVVSEKSFMFDNTTAPALALAILEAAGWPERESTSVTRTILSDLSRVVEFQERVTAEAKEQAKLEAEALDFLNVSRKAKHLGPLGNFDDHTKDAWLAVARKAREMRKP